MLARFSAGGTALVLTWWAFALTALLMVPLVVLLSRAIADADPILLSVATAVGVLAALVQFLGLVRWPFLVPYSSEAERSAPAVDWSIQDRYGANPALTGTWRISGTS